MLINFYWNLYSFCEVFIILKTVFTLVQITLHSALSHLINPSSSLQGHASYLKASKITSFPLPPPHLTQRLKTFQTANCFGSFHERTATALPGRALAATPSNAALFAPTSHANSFKHHTFPVLRSARSFTPPTHPSLPPRVRPHSVADPREVP